MTDQTPSPCAACGNEAPGAFCDQCGTPRAGRFCGDCGAAVDAGARFCGGCGAAVSTGGGREREPRTPWLVAGGLSVLAIGVVLWAAGIRPQGGGLVAPAPAPSAGGGTPPDLTQIAPRDRFTRLNDRIMNAAQSGDSASVIQFWPMAEMAYQQLPAADRDLDARYHMATLHLLVGRIPQVLALTDTMLTEAPDHLLAWYLRGITAEFQGDEARMAEARERFLESYDRERAEARQEYLEHDDLLLDWRRTLTSTPSETP